MRCRTGSFGDCRMRIQVSSVAYLWALYTRIHIENTTTAHIRIAALWLVISRSRDVMLGLWLHQSIYDRSAQKCRLSHNAINSWPWPSWKPAVCAGETELLYGSTNLLSVSHYAAYADSQDYTIFSHCTMAKYKVVQEIRSLDFG